jgi:hypothetical protein
VLEAVKEVLQENQNADLESEALRCLYNLSYQNQAAKEQMFKLGTGESRSKCSLSLT